MKRASREADVDLDRAQIVALAQSWRDAGAL